MENRISRKDDESLYQPKIHSERIKTLYGIKRVTGIPMTVLLDQAIRVLAESYGAEYRPDDEPDLRNIDVETWEDIVEYRELLDKLDFLKALDDAEKMKNNEQGRNTD